jgi:hypothetical protein
MNRYAPLVLAVLLAAPSGITQAQIPRMLSYQGVLSDTLGNPKPDGQYTLTFRLYESSGGGSSLWSEQKTLPLKRGLFSTTLGDQSAFGTAVRFDRPYWLGLQIGTAPELVPRIVLTAAGYSLNAARADTAQYAQSSGGQAYVDSARVAGTVPDNTITSSNIRAGHVVKALNGLTDHVTLSAKGGATIVTSADTIYVDAGSSGSSINGSGSSGQVSFWSGGSSLSGDQNFSWDNTQKRLGVGTSQPLRSFHLSSPTSTWGMMLLENSSVGSNEASIAFKAGSTVAPADIWMAGVGSWGLNNSFVVGRDGPRLTLTPDGSLGLGTTAPSPETKLHIRAISDNFGVLVDADGGAGSEIGLHTAVSAYASLVKNAFWDAGTWRRFDQTKGASQMEFWPGGDMVFRTAMVGANPITWTNAMTLRANGRLGIGTDAPEQLLHVFGESNPRIVVEAPSAATPEINWKRGTEAFSISMNSSNNLTFFNNGTLMSLTPGGSLGIGTYAPEQRLHVYGTGNPRILVEAPDYSTPELNLKRGTSYFNLFMNSSNGLEFYSTGTKMVLTAAGSLGIGTTTPEERLHVVGAVKCGVLKLTGGSDIAERFDVSGATPIEPGMVVSIDPEFQGKLRLSTTAYDHCVAGIVSGAGGVSPGLTMSQDSTIADGAHPVAMTGRVFCRALAVNGSIRPGDFLTTSDVPGYAMKATERDRSIGAVLGKAMSFLDSGEGLVLVLVSLQ